MASADELRDQEAETDEKRQRIEEAAAAREQEEQYQGDLNEKKEEADRAEERIDNPDA